MTYQLAIENTSHVIIIKGITIEELSHLANNFFWSLSTILYVYSLIQFLIMIKLIDIPIIKYYFFFLFFF